MTKTTDTPQTGGLLINYAGKNNYHNQTAVEYVIKYIARENGKSKDDLICCGAMGATYFTNIDMTVREFQCVQLLYNRRGSFGRYIDHEIYSFSEEEESKISQGNISLENIAKKMAQDFYADGFQVYYGVHKPDKTETHIHVHFAVNTVNFRTGKKRHENMGDTQRRQDRLRQIVLAEMNNRQKL